MKAKESKQSFNDFCYKVLDGLYDPKFEYDAQCTGYKLLREMVEKNITPASNDECERWRLNPTKEELLAKPDIKYLTFLHELLRPVIIKHWDEIKTLEL